MTLPRSPVPVTSQGLPTRRSKFSEIGWKEKRPRRHSEPLSLPCSQEMAVPTSRSPGELTAKGRGMNNRNAQTADNSNGCVTHSYWKLQGPGTLSCFYCPLYRFQSSVADLDTVPNGNLVSDSSRLDKLGQLPSTPSAALHYPKPEVRQDSYGHYEEEGKILDVIFSDSGGSEYEDALEGQATDILADSDHQATGGLTQYEQSKPRSSNSGRPQDEGVTSERRKSSTFEERRRSFAAAHPLDFSAIKASVDASHFDAECRIGITGRTCKVGDP